MIKIDAQLSIDYVPDFYRWAKEKTVPLSQALCKQGLDLM